MFCLFSSRLRLASRGAPSRTSITPPRDKQLQRMSEQLMPKITLYTQSPLLLAPTPRLVAVVRGLIGAVSRDVKVLALGFGEDGQLDVELLQVCASDLLVELLGEHMDTKRELLRSGPERNLSEDLVGERAGHHERWVACGASEVDKTTLSKQDDMATVGHRVSIDLGLDVDD